MCGTLFAVPIYYTMPIDRNILIVLISPEFYAKMSVNAPGVTLRNDAVTGRTAWKSIGKLKEAL
jgi:hypothetical protein